MSASHTDLASKTHRPQNAGHINTLPCVPAGALNLRNLLAEPKADPVVSSSESQTFIGQGFGSGISSGASLAQLMCEHEQKSQGTGSVDIGRGFGVPSLSTLTTNPNGPPSLTSTPQSSLSLGLLASLNISSSSLNSSSGAAPPSLLATSLGSLSLGNPKVTGSGSSLTPAPGLGSLSSVLQSSHSVEIGTGGKATTADPKGSPSLAELIQEHANRSPTNCGPFPGPHNSAASGMSQGTAAPAQMLSLSQLASQHQNKDTHVLPQSQSTERPADTLSLSKSTSAGPSGGSLLSLSQLATQHQTNNPLVLSQPLNSESSRNALKPTPGFSEGLSLSQLISQHQGKTSTTTNEPGYSLTSLLSPAVSEGTSVSQNSFKEVGTKHTHRPKPCNQNSKPLRLGQNIDLSTLMAQSPGVGPPHYDDDLSSPSLSSPVTFGFNSTVFAQPSVFAMTLSLHVPSNEKSKRRIKKAKMRRQRTESTYQAFLYSSQAKLLKGKEQQTPLLPITPFHFDTPSPDDIVRANQKKAFTR